MAKIGRYDVIIQERKSNDNIYDRKVQYGSSQMIFTDWRIYDIDLFFSSCDNEYQCISKLVLEGKTNIKNGKLSIINHDGYKVDVLFGNKALRSAVLNLYDGKDSYKNTTKKVRITDEVKEAIDEFKKIVINEKDIDTKERIARSCMTVTLYKEMVEYCKLIESEWLDSAQDSRLRYLEGKVDMYTYKNFRAIVSFVERFKNRYYYNNYQSHSKAEPEKKIVTNKVSNNDKKEEPPVSYAYDFNRGSEELNGKEEFLNDDEYNNMFDDEDNDFFDDEKPQEKIKKY